MKKMTTAAALAVVTLMLSHPTGTRAQSETASTTINTLSREASVMEIAYDTLVLVHALNYNQTRTMLALEGDYTRYPASVRTENAFLQSQIEMSIFELPSLRRQVEELALPEDTQWQFASLFLALEDLAAISSEMHLVLDETDVPAANQIYIEHTDPAYNRATALAHTIVTAAGQIVALEAQRAN